MQPTGDLEELRIYAERLRTLLENLVVRGLRACGPDELGQLDSFSEHLEQTGAAHLASLLADLRRQIEGDDATSAQTLLMAQVNVRLLERLLTLRVVKGQYATAIEARQHFAPAAEIDGANEDGDGDDDDDEGK